MINYEKMTQAISFFIRNIHNKPITKLEIFKLLFLVDRYSLRMFGRSLTEDTYIAMYKCPVPSESKEVIEGYKDEKCQDYFYKYLEIQDVKILLRDNSEINNDVFSENDIEALNAVLDVYKKYNTAQSLVEYTHKFSEWKKYEGKVNEGKVPKISKHLFFGEAIPDDYCPASPARVEAAKRRWLKYSKLRQEIA